MRINREIGAPYALLIEGVPGGEGGGGGTSPSSGGPASSSSTPSNAGSGTGASGTPPSSSTPSSAPVASVPSRSAASTSPGTPVKEAPLASPPSDTGEAADNSFNFDEIFRVTEAPSPIPGIEPVAAEPPPAPAAVKPPAPVAAEAPKPQEAVQPQAPAATPAPSPQVQSPAPTPSDPAALAQALVQHEQQAIDHIAESLFKLSPQEAQALEDDPHGTIPKLLAKAFVKSQQNFFAQLGKIVPAMLTQHSTETKRNTEAEDAFYSVWPDLKGDTYKEQIARVASSYRAANPSAPREQMIREVGTMVMTLAGLAIKPPAQQPAPGAPSAPRGAQPSPFVPIGGGVAAASAPSEGSPYDILGQNQDE